MDKQQLKDWQEADRVFTFDNAVRQMINEYKDGVEGNLNRGEIDRLADHIYYRMLFFEGHITAEGFVSATQHL